MTSLMGVFSSTSVVCASTRVAATAPMAAVARPASRRAGFFMVCLLGGPLNGHGAILVGSTDAGPLGILARDHAHPFATIANIAARPGMEINVVDPFSCNGYRLKGTARPSNARGQPAWRPLEPRPAVLPYGARWRRQPRCSRPARIELSGAPKP